MGARGPKPTDILHLLETNYIPVPFSGCWLWLGSVDSYGYGVCSSPNGKWLMHRLSLLMSGPWPKVKMHACHKCDIPMCINPDHLFWGTQADNMRDAAKKGRLHNTFQASKTHCANGHPYDADNTSFRGNRRICKICQRMAGRRYALANPEKERARNTRRHANDRIKRNECHS